MTRGRELKTPITLMSKFLKPISKLFPKSGVTSLSMRQMNTMAKTMYMLRMKLKKEEKRRALSVRARLTGKTRTNYMV